MNKILFGKEASNREMRAYHLGYVKGWIVGMFSALCLYLLFKTLL